MRVGVFGPHDETNPATKLVVGFCRDLLDRDNELETGMFGFDECDAFILEPSMGLPMVASLATMLHHLGENPSLRLAIVQVGGTPQSNWVGVVHRILEEVPRKVFERQIRFFFGPDDVLPWVLGDN